MSKLIRRFTCDLLHSWLCQYMDCHAGSLGHPKCSCIYHMFAGMVQVDKGRFRDYPGGYDNFLTKNQKESAAMEEKAVKQKKLDQSQIKSKSKVGSAACSAMQCFSSH